MSCLELFLSNVPLLAFLYGLTTLVGLDFLIFYASWSHSGMDYMGLLYMLVICEFTTNF
jgi:hypothetical protein